MAAALAACAAPPVTLYTLDQASPGAADLPLGQRPTVIVLDRVTLPDYLDTQDIVVRRGAVVETSHRGRWASRLSLEVGQLLAARLGRTRPAALVTDQPQTSAPSYRIAVDIGRLDLAGAAGSTQGAATLEADWQIIPRDAAAPILRDRTHIEVTGPIATDRDVVALETAVLTRLAGAIDITRLR